MAEPTGSGSNKRRPDAPSESREAPEVDRSPFETPGFEVIAKREAPQELDTDELIGRVTRTWTVAVSFAKVPLAHIGDKADAIRAAGWLADEVLEERGDPWVQSFTKVFPESEKTDPEAELRQIMGDYWLDGDAITDLLERGR